MLGVRLESIERTNQILLSLNYKKLGLSSAVLPSFRSFEFSLYSQNGEDGILLFIFSLIGDQAKKAVEIGTGDGVDCNCANLVINHGWQGLFIDGDASLIASDKQFYMQKSSAWRFSRQTQPKFLHP